MLERGVCWGSAWENQVGESQRVSERSICYVVFVRLILGVADLCRDTIILWRTCTAKTQHGKFETNISRKGIGRPQSHFPHSCVCDRFIYSNDRSAYSAVGKYVDRSFEYIIRSQKHECGNLDCSRAIPSKGILKLGFSSQCVQVSIPTVGQLITHILFWYFYWHL